MNFFKSTSIPKYVEFFFVKNYVNGHIEDTILINTLPINEQECLIMKTLTAEKEVIQIQSFQDNFIYGKPIVIYGKNAIDNTVDAKFQQLVNLGFKNIYIYRGGMFEWSLLQDIYGKTEFQTTSRILDPLKWCNSGSGSGVGGAAGIGTGNNWGNLLTWGSV